jgi:UDP:flavonoid glycosyltransferase YjiC (YdhE family)
MPEILFATWDGGGNVPPAIAIARQLQARGHSVRFLGHAAQQPHLAASGFELEPVVHARPFSAGGDTSNLTMLRTFGDRGLGEDLLAALARRRADLVVVDALCFGALAAVRRHGVPYVVLEHMFHVAYQGMVRGPLGVTMRLRRLRPQASLANAASRVLTTLPALDRVEGSARLVQVGPVAPWTARPAPVTSTEPTVLISLSTFGFAGMGASLQRVVGAAGGLGARVVVTTGPMIDPADVRAPAGVEVPRYVPHADLMPTATLFVGHGGHGSTMAALAHDLPMVLMPLSPTTDQPRVAKTIEAAGAGRTVGRKDSSQTLAPVLAHMLADGPHRAAAARLGAEIRAMPGEVRGADAVEEALTNSAVVKLTSSGGG